MRSSISVVGVSGSRRDDSNTRAAVAVVLDAAAAAGADTDLVHLGDVDLPLYHPGRDEQGDSAELVRRVRDADAVVLGSPVYHGSYSSTLKNFHDYCSYEEYENTAVGLVAVAGGASYGGTLDHMRSIVRGVHGDCIPAQFGVPNASEQFEDGALVDPDLRERAESFAESLVEHTARYAPPTDPEDPLVTPEADDD